MPTRFPIPRTIRGEASSAPQARFHALLREGSVPVGMFQGATPEAHRAARALGGAAAASAVIALVEAYQLGRDQDLPQRAIDVAYELKLTYTIPSLVALIERTRNTDLVAQAAVRALARMKEAAVGPLLEAFERAPHDVAKAFLAVALVETQVRDGRIREALVAHLDQDVCTAAGLLGEHGDPAALPALVARLDRLDLLPPGKGEFRRCEEIVAVAQAVRQLGHRLTKLQWAKFQRAYHRSGDLLIRDQTGDEYGLPV